MAHISKETRDAILRELSVDDLQAEIDRRPESWVKTYAFGANTTPTSASFTIHECRDAEQQSGAVHLENSLGQAGNR